jgi:hypothetical protein
MTYIHQEYPKCKYSWAGKTVIVHNLEQEAALGGGWADTPAAFTPYRGPRPGRADRDDPLQWVDQWPVAQLSAVDRRRLKAQLLKADAAFWKAPDVPSAEVDTMRLAFVGIAEVLFDAGILTEPLLRNEIEQFVWDSAISGGWWRLASETRRDIFPEQVGHYWVWRDESGDWQMPFRSEIAVWRAKLLETIPSSAAPQPFELPRAKPVEQRKRRPGKQVWATDIDRVKSEIRELKMARFSHVQICARLGDKPRPPNARWSRLSWPEALKHAGSKNAVKSWISRQ